VRTKSLLLSPLLCVACAAPTVSYQVEGTCANGLADGPYALILPNGRAQVTGAFAQGEKQGTFVLYSSSTGAKIAEIPYERDELDGVVRLWFMPESTGGIAGRRKLASAWAAGLREGPSASWYPDEAKRGEALYAHGELVGAKGWDPSGQPLEPEQARSMAAFDVDADRTLYDAYEEVFRDNPVPCR
jgi:antitoxin component YwqK of YwqJK toxin-antitoxin module